MTSFEKIPRPGDASAEKSSNSAESRDASEKDSSLPTAATEAVLAEVDAVHRSGHGNHEDIAHLHDSIHTCECGQVFDEYEEGSVPTLERMFGSLSERIEQADRALREEAERYSEEEVEEEVRVLSLLKGRERQVRTAVEMYVQSVIRFNTLKRLSYNGAREDKENFVRADQARRRLHNSLIESLRVYLKTAQEAERMGLFDDVRKEGSIFALWDIGTDARSIASDRTLLFSEKALERREFVRDWAVAVFFSERLKGIAAEL